MQKERLAGHVFLVFFLSAFLLFLVNIKILFSQEPTQLNQAEIDEYVKLKSIQEASKKFENLGFGISVGVSSFFKNYILEADVENGTIKAKKEGWVFADIMLETHKFWAIKRITSSRQFKSLGLPSSFEFESNSVGIGPFFGILMNSENMISAVTFGAMVGFRPDSSSPNSLNFGAGPIFKFNLKMLRGDLKPDQALPSGITEIKYQEKSALGLAFVISFTWANL